MYKIITVLIMMISASLLKGQDCKFIIDKVDPFNGGLTLSGESYNVQKKARSYIKLGLAIAYIGIKDNGSYILVVRNYTSGYKCISQDDKLRILFEDNSQLTLSATSRNCTEYSSSSIRYLSTSYIIEEGELEMLFAKKPIKIRLEYSTSYEDFDINMKGIDELAKSYYCVKHKVQEYESKHPDNEK